MLSLIPIFHPVYQSWQSLSGPSGYEDLNNMSVAPNYSFDATKRAIASLKLQVEEVSKTEMIKVSGTGAQICLFSSQVALTRLCNSIQEEALLLLLLLFYFAVEAYEVFFSS